LVAGPAYAVRFRNQGASDAGTFRVAIFASIGGTLDDNAPRAIAEVPSLAAGESREMALRLPASAMRLVSTSGSQDGFDRLLVIVDPDDAVVETDKTNNLAAVSRSDLESQVR
jgi:subtilase family serine protease